MSLAAPLALLAVLSGAVELSDRSELRVRDSNEAVGRAIDLETAPALALRLRARTWELALGYTPRFTLRQLDHPPLPEVYHRGAIDLGWRYRRVVAAIHGDASYGTTSFTSLSITPQGAGSGEVVQLPPGTSIGYTASRAAFTMRYVATRRLSLGGRFEYAASGGADAIARAVVPYQEGPTGALDAEVALTRTDRLTTSLSLTRAQFTPGPDDASLEALVTWRHLASRRTSVTLSAGATGVYQRLSIGAAPSRSVYAVAEADFDYRRPPARLEARLSLRLAPVVSWLSGIVDERAQATASATYRPLPRMSVRGQLGVAQSVPIAEDGALTVALAEAAIAAKASPAVEIELGTRGAWQKTRGAAASPLQWVVFAGATFTAPTLRF